MTSMCRVCITFVAFMATLLSLVIAPSAASATSSYDDVIHVEPVLYVYTDGPTKTQKMNISSTWWEDVKQSYTRRLPGLPTWPSNFVALFEDMMENGSYGVVMVDQPAGKTITIFATDDENSYCDFSGPNNNDWLVCRTAPGSTMVRAEYITHNSYGGNGCGGNSCGDNGINIYQKPDIYSSSGASSVWGAPLSEMRSGYVSFFMMDFDIQYPTGYEGEIVPEEPGLLEYVAMGDSFSSGEGVPPFINGTDAGSPNENRCHRSTRAYPLLLEQDTDLMLDLNFVACSGATSDTMLNGGAGSGAWNEDAQVDSISPSTDLVTLTVGGNDIGFKEFMEACFQVGTSCDSSSTIYGTIDYAIMNTLTSDVLDVLETIQTSIGEEADTTVLVMGYASLISDTTLTLESPASCLALLTSGDLSALEELSGNLNSVVSNAVATLDDSRFHFVDPNAIDSTFSNHDMCSEDWYIFPYDLGRPLEYIAHPTLEGQKTYASIIKEYLDNL